MKKITVLFLTFLAISLSSFAQKAKFEWVKHFGVEITNNGVKVYIDKNNNVITVGNFQGTVDFDPGSGFSYLSSKGLDDIYIAKYTPKGELIWAKSIGGASYDQATGLVLDDRDNIYFTGIFRQTVDFDPGMGIFNLTIPSGNYGAFVSKLDASGNFIWAKETNSKDMASSSIAIDPLGQLYTIGYFKGTVDFDPNAGVSNMTAIGSYDFYVSKSDTNGNFIWSKNFGGTGLSYALGRGIAFDNKANVILGGSFGGTIDFDPGSGVQNLTSMGDFDVFITKLNSSGNFVWTKQIGGTFEEQLTDLCVDKSNNILYTGYFSKNCDFDPSLSTSNLYTNGSRGIFVSKLDQSGNYMWAKKMSGSSTNLYANHSNAITQDKNENIYITGSFQYSVDFDPGSDSFIVSTDGYHNIFIEKMTPTGDFVWVKTVVGSSIGCSSGDYGNDIQLDNFGNIYTTGAFTMSKRFNPEDPSYYCNASKRHDIFLLKLSQQESSTISKQFNSDELKIYPNPSFGVFNVEVTNIIIDKIEVYNLLGTLVYESNNISTINKFDISQLAAGVYAIKLFNNGQLLQTEKLLKK